MKIAQWNYLGPKSTPQEVRDLRASSFDFHKTLGKAVIHKHRWNPQDVRDGKAVVCPFQDIAYDSGHQDCPYCFGTGYLGGWGDAQVTFLTISDARQDQLKVGREGVIYLDQHPGFTAPWVPLLGDGDLIIIADLESDNWDVIQEHERYILQEVTPVTMRGAWKGPQPREYRVNQSGNIDKLPFGHEYYDVPLVFDYASVPEPPDIPDGGDPDDYPTPDGATLKSAQYGFQIIGRAGNTSELDIGFAIFGGGTETSRGNSFTIVGVDVGTHVIFDEDY